MKRKIYLLFFILGISSIISQVILFRELIVSFYGNEFFTSLILAAWLFWVAVGSYWLIRIFTFKGGKEEIPALTICLILVPFFLLSQILLIRFLAGQTDFRGELPNLGLSLLTAIFLPAPLCLILGLQFSLGSRFLAKKAKTKTIPISRAYFLETLGFIFGGLIFSFFLVRLNVFQGLALVAILNLAVCFLLLRGRQKNYLFLKIAGLGLFFVFLFLALPSPALFLSQLTQSFRFKGLLVESFNSLYGHIAVTKINNQYNFYESGLLMASVPETGSAQEITTFFDEEIAHLTLLQHPSPEKVLLVGGGLPGLIPEILRHPLKELYYLELDSQLVETLKKYLPSESRKSLTDERLKIISLDARYFLNSSQQQFDVIIINLPNPSTALLNRFYSQEFFEQTKTKLKPKGILATWLTYSSSQVNKNLENLNASLYKTLKTTFSYLLILPEETNLFLASPENVLSTRPTELIERYEQRGLENSFVTKNYLQYRLTNDRIAKALNAFEKNEQVKTNQDFKPISYFYHTLFWSSLFYPRLAEIGRTINPLLIYSVVGIIIFILSLVAFSGPSKYRSSKTAGLSMAIAGFGLMAQEIILLFAYQTLCGFLYFRIALILASIMAGMALGTFFGQYRVQSLNSLNFPNPNSGKLGKLGKTHLFLIVSLIALIFVLNFFSKSSLELWQKELILLILAVSAGFFPGLIFPLANQLYFHNQKEINKKTGTIYSADLIGSSLGALFSGILLVPLMGANQTLKIVIILNLWLVGLFLFFKKPEP